MNKTETINLSDNQIKILGRPNFACAEIAKILINGGVYEDKADKAEYEQAVYIHWACALLEAHGDSWKEKANSILKNIVASFKQVEEPTNE